jgi:phosphoenolpyruvate-protein phosphotransferase (PTS system enzyme I)
MASKPERIFQGSGVSHGIALGQALKIDSHNRIILKIHVEDVEAEVARFLRAIETSKEQLKALKFRLEEKVGSEHSIILDAHLLILEDRTLNTEILATIRKSKANAEWALMQATDKWVHAYESLEDEYFRERHSDIEHVAERILINLSGDHPFSWAHLPEDQIIVSRDFNPSNFATMDLQKVRGLVLESGGRTSHTAILSRGLQLPAVMGISDFFAAVSAGDTLLVDGDSGQVIVNPSLARIESISPKVYASSAAAETTLAQSGRNTHTKDGTQIFLRANTELPYELTAAKRCGAEGIGLYRSEFLYFGHPQGFAKMEEQLAVYSMLAREMSPHPVAIRTLDAGSEKVYNSPDLTNQANPSMGLRGIRLSLHAIELFRIQIEAILRASCDGNIEIVLPMVSTIEEVRQARSLIDQVLSELVQKPDFVLKPVPMGVMIEVPAAVLALETLARESDFLCVGTNDLIQYMLAVDRGNPQVAYLFQPLHPSVLHCLSLIAEVAAKLNKPVRICGEISSNPFFAVLLLGMGFSQLSMNPLSIPAIRKVLLEVSMESSRQIARQSREFATAYEVHKYLVSAVSRIIPWDLSAYVNEISPPQRTI